MDFSPYLKSYLSYDFSILKLASLLTQNQPSCRGWDQASPRRVQPAQSLLGVMVGPTNTSIATNHISEDHFWSLKIIKIKWKEKPYSEQKVACHRGTAWNWAAILQNNARGLWVHALECELWPWLPKQHDKDLVHFSSAEAWSKAQNLFIETKVLVPFQGQTAVYQQKRKEGNVKGRLHLLLFQGLRLARNAVLPVTVHFGIREV